MTEPTSSWHTVWTQRWRGMALAAIVAVAAMALASHYGAPVMLFALLLGMAVNFLSEDARAKPGIEFTAKQVLRWGVALLGLRITAAQVQSLGWQPVAMVLASVVTVRIVCGDSCSTSEGAAMLRMPPR